MTIENHGQQVSVTVDLSTEFVHMLAHTEAEVPLELRKLTGLELVRSGRLAFTRAAELLGLPQEDFIRYLSDHEVSVLEYDEDELAGAGG